MKKLVTKNNVHDFLMGDESQFYVDSSMIITPGVKDILRNRGIVIVYGDRKVDSTKEITKTITNLLTQKFKITDDVAIKEITSKVLNRIQE